MADLYDPLTYDNLMAGLVLHFERQPVKPLSAFDDVEGPGIYSLFYAGGLSCYAPICSGQRPIYVGKAVPPGWRKGESVDEDSPALRRRIRKHRKSIQEANNLDICDFTCRCMAVVPVWITLAERFVIDHYRPVWNLCLDGFGDNDPGSGRRNSKRSWWDTLHPGRDWVAKRELVAKGTTEDAQARVARFFAEAEQSG